MRIVVPAALTRFTIPVSTTPPAIDFETDAIGPHVWTWKVHWRGFHHEGQVKTPSNRWNAVPMLKDRGGTLDVHATAASNAGLARPETAYSHHVAVQESAVTHVKIVGLNPNKSDVDAYLAAQSGSEGFGAILAHETHDRHFTALGEPIVSFDGGYGICQLTNPVPTFEQCWSWKRNVDAGLLLFSEKRRAAITYLSQQGRTYSDDQLVRETVSRWNGGAYHIWDGKAWIRDPDIVCDPATGNIGWDTTKPVNQDTTVKKLHARDTGQFRRGHDAGDNWRYSGVCYADAVLG